MAAVSATRRAAAVLPAVVAASALLALVAARPGRAQQPGTPLVLDNLRLIDGTGRPAVEPARIVVRERTIEAVGRTSDVEVPSGTVPIDLAGRPVLPGLIDLHFHIEDDPKLALRQLAHGVTSFRDPGEWREMFVPLERLMAEEQLPGPRMFLCGPHIDGESPAYPEDAFVARDPEEARRQAHRAIAEGATALKIYYRLPLASARAVIDVCRAAQVPCTAHLEIVDARDLLIAGLAGIEHITSLGTAIVPLRRAEAYRQAVLKDNAYRRDGRYTLFAEADLDGAAAQDLYRVISETRPFIDPTLAVFEARPEDGPPKGSKLAPDVRAKGFAAMKRLVARVHAHGARIVMGGHTAVPHGGRGEAPWRELELLVEAGLSPMEAIVAATRNGAAFLGRAHDLGTLEPGKLADLIVLDGDPLTEPAAIRRVTRVMVNGRWIDVDRYRTY
jgi:imidazolonepropionase-like amidohydrolase